MKFSYLLFLISLPVWSEDIADQSQDEYDYIAPPSVVQAFDLADSDHDGVINARDLCPKTPQNAKINNDGCETYHRSKTQQQLRILFENDSSNVNSIFNVQIKQMANFLASYPETSIELRGYASPSGKTQYNQALSKQRANSVKARLIEEGVSADRIRIVGFGESNPEERGKNQISDARNRRVSATVVGYKGDVEKRWTIFSTLPPNRHTY
ncbi:OmpA family protein [Vibrio gazogenes]|uniref:OmpA family protein n=1 Tax=Vibrio gazogenes DSM 21264 = NBRC 103151 TaxID=1123492 RepID=A0A1M5AJ07_VIBGA|nr:OmpA family protein [Vibrio gazogenes]USP12597.1 OmpA family protein [Vibrio gazogenes]SHF30114.1 OmpA family protein [Vibrio gazogenes DSM 21264] [Vibrio gazogenes DSM 21264 = NBRC 103151]SJN57834.1 Outer membrane porin F precursor [Vibrio gazogenes]